MLVKPTKRTIWNPKAFGLLRKSAPELLPRVPTSRVSGLGECWLMESEGLTLWAKACGYSREGAADNSAAPLT